MSEAPPAAPRSRAWLGLRLLFVLLGLLVLGIAGVGLVLFRVYDNPLIRQTEFELIAQGTAVASVFKHAVLERLEKPGGDAASPAVQRYGNAVAEAFRALHDPDQELRPLPATLALGSDAVRPRAEPALSPAEPADPIALAAGASLLAILKETRQTTLASLRVVDYRGTVVATSGQELGQSLHHREEVRRALQGEVTSLLRKRVSDHPAPPYSSISRETGVRVFVALPVVASGRVLGAVVLSRTPMTLGKAFYQDRFSLLAIALILVSAVLFVSLLAAALIVRPVRALIRQTQAIAAGKTKAARPLARAGTREIAQLSHAFALMSSRLQERAAYIQSFAASVSHEFKTPLTAMQGTAELLREHGADMAPAERERFLADLAADTERLGRLVHRVLELARADMLAPGDERVAAGEVIASTAERCRREGMQVVTTGLPHTGQIKMNGHTLETILRQLADNAREHGGERVALTIDLGWQSAPAAAVIEVGDDGPGISEANRGRVFDPFFTTNRDRGGTGMGLTIARALLHSHGGSIALVPSEKGARFRLTIPA
jgi:signal transduction histidine kinase